MYDSATSDSSFYGEPSFQGFMRASRSHPTTLAVQPPAVRPLSSADETGPVAKKPRSTRQRGAPPPSSAPTTVTDNNPPPLKKSALSIFQSTEDRSSKNSTTSKARARPALTIANIFSSSGRSAQNAAPSSKPSTLGIGKPASGAGTRRSTRLQSGGSRFTKVGA